MLVLYVPGSETAEVVGIARQVPGGGHHSANECPVPLAEPNQMVADGPVDLGQDIGGRGGGPPECRFAQCLSVHWGAVKLAQYANRYTTRSLRTPGKVPNTDRNSA